MIKAVIFDCFGVLTSDTWREFLEALPDDANIEEARRLNHLYDAGKITIKEFLQGVEKATGNQPDLVEDLVNNERSKNIPLLKYIKKLSDNYKIGLLSNIGTSWIRDEFLNTKEQSYFSNMTLSYEVGITKPDVRIYKIACQDLGVKPQETVFVDDIEAYCRSAEKLGIKGVHYKNFKQMKLELESILSHK